MKPERIKAIRQALRRADGRKSTQREVSLFLRMGEVSLARYEAGANAPCTSNALLIEMLTDRRIVERIAELNKHDGVFSDIRLAHRCWDCESYNTTSETITHHEKGRGNIPAFSYERDLITCQDCGAVWHDSNWRNNHAMAGFMASMSIKDPALILMTEYQNTRNLKND